MKLITETYHDNIETLIENSSSGRKFKIEGPFAIAEVVNGNKRSYPQGVMDEAMTRYIGEKVTRGQGFGELNHPQQPQVDFERVVMVIENLTKKGNQYIGKGTIINEGLGKIVTAIMEAGGSVGVSTRALGMTEMRNGISYVKPGLRFSAVDVVSEPSGPGCFVNGIMEGVNYQMLDDGTVIQLAVDAIAKKTLSEEKALKVFADLMLKFGDK